MGVGYLLLAQRQSTLQFYIKHFLPLILAFFFWSALYDLIGNDFYTDNFSIETIIKLFFHILRSATVGYYWFFYPLIAIYLFVPVLWVFLPEKPDRVIYYYIGLWVLGFAIMPFIRSAINMKNYGLEPYLLQRYVGYFILGYYLAQTGTRQAFPWLAAGIFLTAFSFSYAVFYFNLPPTDNEDFFRSYMSFNIIAMTCSFYILIHWLARFVPQRSLRLLEFMDEHTFGIYLSHLMILGFIITELKGYDLLTGLLSYSIILASVAFIVSFLLVAILRKIPLVKHIVPHLGK
jgi:surface polysaccharide O-acyltransferase-like enzyme